MLQTAIVEIHNEVSILPVSMTTIGHSSIVNDKYYCALCWKNLTTEPFINTLLIITPILTIIWGYSYITPNS